MLILSMRDLQERTSRSSELLYYHYPTSLKPRIPSSSTVNLRQILLTESQANLPFKMRLQMSSSCFAI